MDTRYHIEELLSQDARGVVFQGSDTVTGIVVAIRRFISSHAPGVAGAATGGQAFAEATELMKGVSHPSLRRVLAGGCDPVDGMPYLVTRWVDGILLREVVDVEGPLDADLAVGLLAQLLNLNMMLSKTLGREGLWAEASLESVVVKPPREEGEPATAIFWVSPWRWLGDGALANGAFELADFAEGMLGGPRQLATQHANTEIGAWIQRIRNKQLTGLREIRDALNNSDASGNTFIIKEKRDEPTDAAAATPASQPAPLAPPPRAPKTVMATALPEKPTAAPKVAGPIVQNRKVERPVPKKPSANTPKSSGKKPAILVAALLAMIGGASWLFMNSLEDSHMPDGPTTAAPFADEDAPDVAMPRSERQSVVDSIIGEIDTHNTAAEERRYHAERRGYYTIDQGDLLLDRSGHAATLRGELARIRLSASGLTMYLEFSESAPVDEPRAFAMTRDLTDGIRPEELEELVGKRIEIRGQVDIENISRNRRPRIHLRERAQITVLEGAASYELR